MPGRQEALRVAERRLQRRPSDLMLLRHLDRFSPTILALTAEQLYPGTTLDSRAIEW